MKNAQDNSERPRRSVRAGLGETAPPATNTQSKKPVVQAVKFADINNASSLALGELTPFQLLSMRTTTMHPQLRTILLHLTAFGTCEPSLNGGQGVDEVPGRNLPLIPAGLLLKQEAGLVNALSDPWIPLSVATQLLWTMADQARTHPGGVEAQWAATGQDYYLLVLEQEADLFYREMHSKRARIMMAYADPSSPEAAGLMPWDVLTPADIEPWPSSLAQAKHLAFNAHQREYLAYGGLQCTCAACLEVTYPCMIEEKRYESARAAIAAHNAAGTGRAKTVPPALIVWHGDQSMSLHRDDFLSRLHEEKQQYEVHTMRLHTIAKLLQVQLAERVEELVGDIGYAASLIMRARQGHMSEQQLKELKDAVPEKLWDAVLAMRLVQSATILATPAVGSSPLQSLDDGPAWHDVTSWLGLPSPVSTAWSGHTHAPDSAWMEELSLAESIAGAAYWYKGNPHQPGTLQAPLDKHATVYGDSHLGGPGYIAQLRATGSELVSKGLLAAERLSLLPTCPDGSTGFQVVSAGSCGGGAGSGAGMEHGSEGAHGKLMTEVKRFLLPTTLPTHLGHATAVRDAYAPADRRVIVGLPTDCIPGLPPYGVTEQTGTGAGGGGDGAKTVGKGKKGPAKGASATPTLQATAEVAAASAGLELLPVGPGHLREGHALIVPKPGVLPLSPPVSQALKDDAGLALTRSLQAHLLQSKHAGMAQCALEGVGKLMQHSLVSATQGDPKATLNPHLPHARRTRECPLYTLKAAHFATAVLVAAGMLPRDITGEFGGLDAVYRSVLEGEGGLPVRQKLWCMTNAAMAGVLDKNAVQRQRLLDAQAKRVAKALQQPAPADMAAEWQAPLPGHIRMWVHAEDMDVEKDIRSIGLGYYLDLPAMEVLPEDIPFHLASAPVSTDGMEVDTHAIAVACVMDATGPLSYAISSVWKLGNVELNSLAAVMGSCTLPANMRTLIHAAMVPFGKPALPECGDAYKAAAVVPWSVPHIPLDVVMASMEAAILSTPPSGPLNAAVGPTVHLPWGALVASVCTVDHEQGTGLYLGPGHIGHNAAHTAYVPVPMYGLAPASYKPGLGLSIGSAVRVCVDMVSAGWCMARHDPFSPSSAALQTWYSSGATGAAVKACNGSDLAISFPNDGRQPVMYGFSGSIPTSEAYADPVPSVDTCAYLTAVCTVSVRVRASQLQGYAQCVKALYEEALAAGREELEATGKVGTPVGLTPMSKVAPAFHALPPIDPRLAPAALTGSAAVLKTDMRELRKKAAAYTEHSTCSLDCQEPVLCVWPAVQRYEPLAGPGYYKPWVTGDPWTCTPTATVEYHIHTGKALQGSKVEDLFSLVPLGLRPGSICVEIMHSRACSESIAEALALTNPLDTTAVVMKGSVLPGYPAYYYKSGFTAPGTVDVNKYATSGGVGGPKGGGDSDSDSSDDEEEELPEEEGAEEGAPQKEKKLRRIFIPPPRPGLVYGMASASPDAMLPALGGWARGQAPYKRMMQQHEHLARVYYGDGEEADGDRSSASGGAGSRGTGGSGDSNGHRPDLSKPALPGTEVDDEALATFSGVVMYGRQEYAPELPIIDKIELDIDPDAPVFLTSTQKRLAFAHSKSVHIRALCCQLGLTEREAPTARLYAMAHLASILGFSVSNLGKHLMSDGEGEVVRLLPCVVLQAAALGALPCTFAGCIPAQLRVLLDVDWDAVPSPGYVQTSLESAVALKKEKLHAALAEAEAKRKEAQQSSAVAAVSSEPVPIPNHDTEPEAWEAFMAKPAGEVVVGKGRVTTSHKGEADWSDCGEESVSDREKVDGGDSDDESDDDSDGGGGGRSRAFTAGAAGTRTSSRLRRSGPPPSSSSSAVAQPKATQVQVGKVDSDEEPLDSDEAPLSSAEEEESSGEETSAKPSTSKASTAAHVANKSDMDEDEEDEDQPATGLAASMAKLSTKTPSKAPAAKKASSSASAPAPSKPDYFAPVVFEGGRPKRAAALAPKNYTGDSGMYIDSDDEREQKAKEKLRSKGRYASSDEEEGGGDSSDGGYSQHGSDEEGGDEDESMGSLVPEDEVSDVEGEDDEEEEEGGWAGHSRKANSRGAGRRRLSSGAGGAGGKVRGPSQPHATKERAPLAPGELAGVVPKELWPTREQMMANTQYGMQCKLCGEKYATPNDVVARAAAHMQKDHADECKLEAHCTLCGKQWDLSKPHGRSDLRRHTEAHIPQHQCLHCGQWFDRSSTLRRHILTFHECSERYPCPTCGKTFMHQHHVKTHIASAHEKVQVTCSEGCGKVFTKATQMKHHVEADHLGRRYTCPVSACKGYNQKHLANYKSLHWSKVHAGGQWDKAYILSITKYPGVEGYPANPQP